MLFEHIISLIAPHTCLGCTVEGTLLCRNCVMGLKPAVARCYICQQISPQGMTCPSCLPQTAVKCVRSLVAYEGAAKDLLWRLKAERARSAAHAIGLHCAALVNTDSDTIITYVPTAPIRVRQRGYDQARLIARAVAQYTNMPMAPLLARSTSNRQVGANKQTRQRQLTNAFRPVNGYMATKHVILIDDVITTGSSIRVAGDVLAASGALSITAITFAQA